MMDRNSKNYKMTILKSNNIMFLKVCFCFNKHFNSTFYRIKFELEHIQINFVKQSFLDHHTNILYLNVAMLLIHKAEIKKIFNTILSAFRLDLLLLNIKQTL